MRSNVYVREGKANCRDNNDTVIMCFGQAVAAMRRRLRKLTEAMLTVTVTVTRHDLRLVEQGYTRTLEVEVDLILNHLILLGL